MLQSVERLSQKIQRIALKIIFHFTFRTEFLKLMSLQIRILEVLKCKLNKRIKDQAFSTAFSTAFSMVQVFPAYEKKFQPQPQVFNSRVTMFSLLSEGKSSDPNPETNEMDMEQRKGSDNKSRFY